MTTQNKPEILLVDDEPNILQAYKRNLRKWFSVLIASGGVEALQILEKYPATQVIVSDMRMPEMDGLQLLKQVKDAYPDISRVMLTGNADQQTAMDAINEGDIFRFHSKPCSPETLASTINDGIEQYKLHQVEKDLLENTLHGAVQALVEVLSLVNPEAFGRSTRIADLTRLVAKSIGMKNIWFLDTLATLSQIGCVILPDSILQKMYAAKALNDEEQQMFDMYPAMGADIIGKIPRMEDIAYCLRYQLKNYDGTGVPNDDVAGKDIPAGARILHAIIDLDNIINSGRSGQQAYAKLLQQKHWYDPNVLLHLKKVLGIWQTAVVTEISHGQLLIGMTIAKDITTTDGVLIVKMGHVISQLSLERLNIFAHQQKLNEPLYVILADSASD